MKINPDATTMDFVIVIIGIVVLTAMAFSGSCEKENDEINKDDDNEI